jgi:predicted protein tyrosine phosphatase
VKLNRLANVKNPYQGNTKKVLCVCSAGLLRSPTAAVVLSAPPFNYNTRAVGMSADYALIPIDLAHVKWADEIVYMDPEYKDTLITMVDRVAMGMDPGPKLYCLEIEDSYPYRDPRLMHEIRVRYANAIGLDLG